MSTGHGCFVESLNQIEQEAIAQYHHCGSERDYALYILEDCFAWESVNPDRIDRMKPVTTNIVHGNAGKW